MKEKTVLKNKQAECKYTYTIFKTCIIQLFNDYKFVLIVSTALSIIAFGTAIFNKFSFHDEAYELTDVGATYISGRWMLGFLRRIVKILFRSITSLPIINVGLTVVFLSLVIWILTKLFSINKKYQVFCLCIILICSPVIAALFAFMFTAPYYIFGLLLSTFSVYLVSKYSKWYVFITAVLLQAMSIGIYQSFIPFALSLLLIVYITEIYKADNNTILLLLRRAGRYVLFCVAFIALYFAITKATIAIFHVELTDYKGINQMGQEPVGVYLSRILGAYYNFINPTYYVKMGLLPVNTKYVYYLLLGLFVTFSCMVIVQTFRKNKWNGLLILIVILLLPLAINFIFVMCESVHTLMLYSCNVLFVSVIVFYNTIVIKRDIIRQVVSICMSAVLLFIGVSFIYLDNSCFLKAELIQDRLFSNYTTLITRIKSVDGYKDDMSVSFVNYEEFSDATLKDTDGVVVNNYIQGEPTVSFIFEPYNYQTQISLLTGFTPDYIDGDEFEDNQLVNQMPSYPDDGSIQVIDNTVVVKFN